MKIAVRMNNGEARMFENSDQFEWGHQLWREFLLAQDPETKTVLVQVK